MKKAINKSATQGLEIFKRILFSFQVLIVGLAIPVLFFLGISTREDQKRAKETEMSVKAENPGMTAQSVIEFPVIEL